MSFEDVLVLSGTLAGVIAGVAAPLLWYFVRKEKRDVAVKKDIEAIRKCVTDDKEDRVKKDTEIINDLDQLKAAVHTHLLQSTNALATISQHTEQLRDHEVRIRKIEGVGKNVL